MSWGKEREECKAGEGHVELITYLQLLVGHGGQSCHVEGEVVGVVRVHLGVCCLVVVPHEHTLRDERQTEESRRRAGLVHFNWAGVKNHQGRK